LPLGQLPVLRRHNSPRITAQTDHGNVAFGK
jgi:hypothetical protein